MSSLFPAALIFLIFFQVYVLKRPYVDEFLQKMGELFECVLFTASLAKVSIYPITLRYYFANFMH